MNEYDILSQSVSDLIGRMLGEEQVSNFHSFMMRILTSSLKPSIECDEAGLCAMIKRILVKENKENGPSFALEFTSLHDKLMKLPILENRWNVLYLLHALRQKGPMEDMSGKRADSSRGGGEAYSSITAMGLPSIGYNVDHREKASSSQNPRTLLQQQQQRGFTGKDTVNSSREHYRNPASGKDDVSHTTTPSGGGGHPLRSF